MQFNLDAVAIKNNVVGDAAEPNGESAFRLWPWLAAVMSGLLCAACFPPFDQGWFVLDCADAIDRRNLVFRERTRGEDGCAISFLDMSPE